MLKKRLDKREKWLVLFGLFLVLGFATAYNSGGPPSVFGHSEEEIENIGSFSTNYSMGVGALIKNPEIIMEIDYDSSSGPQGPFYGLIDVKNNANIPILADEVLVYVTSSISQKSSSNTATWDLEMNMDGLAWGDLIMLDERWDNLQGDFLVRIPLNSSQMLAFRASGSPKNAYVRVEVQGYSA